MLIDITKKVINKQKLNYDDVEILLKADTNQLCKSADKIKNYFCGNLINLCSVISGKSGNCSENCKFCAQSLHYNTDVVCHNFLDEDIIVDDAVKHSSFGIQRYSIVTSGRKLNDSDFEKSCSAYRKIHKSCNIGLCASHGLMSYDNFLKLKDSGVTRYHCNIETSREFFGEICTTHTFDEKLEAIDNAKKAGLEICSGGIIGMGETMRDRVSMAFTLSELEVQSIPINVLTPIKNTPFENYKALAEDEILRTIAIFRFINPTAWIRIAAGRKLLSNNGLNAFYSGANAAITGDYLTTTGSTIRNDIQMFKNNGFILGE